MRRAAAIVEFDNIPLSIASANSSMSTTSTCPSGYISISINKSLNVNELVLLLYIVSIISQYQYTRVPFSLNILLTLMPSFIKYAEIPLFISCLGFKTSHFVMIMLSLKCIILSFFNSIFLQV